jgi:hypothetical protein
VFSDVLTPCMGMPRTLSHREMMAGSTPQTSLPITSATGPRDRSRVWEKMGSDRSPPSSAHSLKPRAFRRAAAKRPFEE